MNVYFSVVVDDKDGTSVGSRGELLEAGQLLGPSFAIDLGPLIKTVANRNPLGQNFAHFDQKVFCQIRRKLEMSTRLLFHFIFISTGQLPIQDTRKSNQVTYSTEILLSR